MSNRKEKGGKQCRYEPSLLRAEPWACDPVEGCSHGSASAPWKDGWPSGGRGWGGESRGRIALDTAKDSSYFPQQTDLRVRTSKLPQIQVLTPLPHHLQNHRAISETASWVSLLSHQCPHMPQASPLHTPPARPGSL